MIFAYILLIFFIIIGLCFLFARDFTWKVTKRLHRMERMKSERTKAWDAKTIFLGIVIIGASIFMFVMVIHHEINSRTPGEGVEAFDSDQSIKSK